MNIVRCHACHAPKWKGDPCNAVNCPTNSTVVMNVHPSASGPQRIAKRLTGKTFVTIRTVK